MQLLSSQIESAKAQATVYEKQISETNLESQTVKLENLQLAAKISNFERIIVQLKASQSNEIQRCNQ
jgi:hypothetical protein